MVQGQADHQVARVAFMAELADTHGQEPIAQPLGRRGGHGDRRLARSISPQSERVVFVE